MNASAALRETILAEGLEDLIPLPEIALTVKGRQLVAPEQVILEVSAALVDLLNEDRIQVWGGHWSDEPQVLDRETALTALSVPKQYEFNSSADLARRLYYVNVENLRVDTVPT